MTMLHPGLRDSWAEYEKTVGAEAAEDVERFKAAIYRERFPHLFPPPLFDGAFVAELTADAQSLLRLLYSLPDRIFDGNVAAWMEFQGLPGDERDLLSSLLSERNLLVARQFARPDFLLTAEGPRLVEVNVSAPLGGLNTHDPYVRQFRRSGYHDHLLRAGFPVSAPDMTSVWGAALRQFARVRPETGRPVLYEAIANPEDINSGRTAFEQLVGENGYDYANGLVQSLDVTDAGVFLDGRRIHAIFTMYTWKEAREFVPPALTRALADADAAGLVDFVAPPTYALFDHKSNLELLSSPEFAGFFSEPERRLIRRYVPETFRLTAANAERVVGEKDRLVLKPASEYGGRGILFGDQMSPGEWAGAVRAAVASGEGHVCQERLAELWRYPGPDGREYHVVLGPLVFAGEYGGTLVRWTDVESRNLLINVRNGAEAGALLSA
ncbi:hypothetical protein [Micromonospora sp. CPCC 205561]|uniref:hypothetical protein n=1 Tax=Micromonospora sp. CPCC 205561 TaxID=3122407 RepID=UPI002FF42DEB